MNQILVFYYINNHLEDDGRDHASQMTSSTKLTKVSRSNKLQELLLNKHCIRLCPCDVTRDT